MKRLLIIATLAATLAGSAASAETYTAIIGGYASTCSFTRTTVDCLAAPLQDSSTKILVVAPRSAESEEAWRERCKAVKVPGKGSALDRWEIGNPECR